MIKDNRIKDQKFKDQRIINPEIIGSRIKELIMQRSKDWGSKIQGLMINDQRSKDQGSMIKENRIKDQRINNAEILGSRIKWLIIRAKDLGSKIQRLMIKDQRIEDQWFKTIGSKIKSSKKKGVLIQRL